MSGESKRFTPNEICSLYTTETIVATEFAASNISNDVTLRDMLIRVCQSVGVRANFPGDIMKEITASVDGEVV